MIESEPVPTVDDDELLARFIVNSNEFRLAKSHPRLVLMLRSIAL